MGEIACSYSHNERPAVLIHTLCYLPFEDFIDFCFQVSLKNGLDSQYSADMQSHSRPSFQTDSYHRRVSGSSYDSSSAMTGTAVGRSSRGGSVSGYHDPHYRDHGSPMPPHSGMQSNESMMHPPTPLQPHPLPAPMLTPQQPTHHIGMEELPFDPRQSQGHMNAPPLLAGSPCVTALPPPQPHPFPNSAPVLRPYSPFRPIIYGPAMPLMNGQAPSTLR